MKKFFAVMLSLMLTVLTFASCQSTDKTNSTTNSDPGTNNTGKKYKVAIVQLADNGAFTEMRESFIQEMRTLGYDEAQMIFDIKNAQGDQSALNTISQGLKNGDYDLIVPIVTPATMSVVNQGLKTPVVFISVTNPVGSGIMTSMEKPDKNATGTSNIVPVDQIFGLAKELTPDVKKIGILYCSGEDNAVKTAAKSKDYLSQSGYAYEEVTVTNSSEVQSAATSLAAKCDALYIPIDSTVQAAMEQVVEAATAKKIPVYGSDPVMVQKGALASVSVSNTQLGEKAADMADKILKGTPVSEVPAVALTDYQYVINSKTASTLGIKTPTGDNYQFIGA